MARWMDIAWQQVGTAEVPGAAANPQILDYFREVGHPEITSDETAWCAAGAGYCLSKAGVPLDRIPQHERLRAFAYLALGTPIDAPRVGCLAIWEHHVGFVAGFTDTHIQLLGANQADAFNVTAFKRASVIGYRWPETLTPADLDASGSRIAKASAQIRNDGINLGGSNIALPQLPTIPPGFGKAAGQARDAMGLFETFSAFATFAWTKLPLLLLAASVFWIGRMIWNAHLIRQWRAEDASTGAHTGRPTPAPGASDV